MGSMYAQALLDACPTRHLHAFALHPGRGNFTAGYGPEGAAPSSTAR